MDLYSNAVMFSRALVKDNPKAVQGFVKALNRAIKDTIANPDAAMDAVMAREPLLKKELEKDRLIATLKEEMNHPEIAKIGLGDIDTDRLKRAITMVVDANQLPRIPANEEVFDRRFLPPRAELISKF
jgi:NitT/TauT family transport system substrate-binding protein